MLSRLAESYLQDRGFELESLVNASGAEKLSALALCGAEAVLGRSSGQGCSIPFWPPHEDLEL